jgi:hypothetical protein
MRGGAWVVIVLAVPVTACSTSTSAEGIDSPCTRTTDCQGGLVCGAQGFCTLPDASDDDGPSPQLADAGDAGDAGAIDAGRAD